jgi:hypothetical protein
VSNCDSESVGGVGRFRNFRQSENSSNHVSNLSFLSTPRPGYSGFYLSWSVKGNGYLVAVGKVQNHTADLSDAHDGTQVLLRKNSFESYCVGLVVLNYRFDAITD